MSKLSKLLFHLSHIQLKHSLDERLVPYYDLSVGFVHILHGRVIIQEETRFFQSHIIYYFFLMNLNPCKLLFQVVQAGIDEHLALLIEIFIVLSREGQYNKVVQQDIHIFYVRWLLVDSSKDLSQLFNIELWVTKVGASLKEGCHVPSHRVLVLHLNKGLKVSLY